MNTLSIWRFDTTDGAEAALRPLERLQNRRLITIDDAAVVAWASGARRPRTYQAGTAAGTVAVSGAFWGLLFGTVFLLPLAGVAVDATAGLSRVGLSDAFLQRVRDRITPATSGLFLLSQDAVLDRIREAFASRQADLLVISLSREQEHALRQAFEADTDADTDADTNAPT
jgi:uncharacterized membrane protein